MRFWGSGWWTGRRSHFNPLALGPSIFIFIKTHGSESRGQERAKRIAKNKTRDELLCFFYTSESFRNMTS